MKKTLLVYDNLKRTFRNLERNNYNDDIIVGTIFLNRNALNIIKKYYIICGFLLIGKNKERLYIDIQENKISLLEGMYNCMPDELKEELVDYCITEKPNRIWSRFFFQWQFLADFNAFEDNGSFIKILTNIIEDPKLISILTDHHYDLIFPTTYYELCLFVRNITGIFGDELFKTKYNEEFHYVVHSLMNEYHINLTDEEIIKYTYQICNILMLRYEDE